MVSGKLDSDIQNNKKTNPFSYTIYTVNSRWIRDLNVRLETINSYKKT